MKKIITSMLILFSLPVFSGETIKWNQKEFPEIFYLYRDHGNNLGTPEEKRESQEKTYATVRSLIEEAKASDYKFVTPVFFRLNRKHGKVMEGGLQLVGPRTKLMEKKTRIRPAGKFLTAEFVGKASGIDAIFKDLPEKIHELSLTLSSDEVFLYKTVGSPGTELEFAL